LGKVGYHLLCGKRSKIHNVHSIRLLSACRLPQRRQDQKHEHDEPGSEAEDACGRCRYSMTCFVQFHGEAFIVVACRKL